jgi:hypothetical protein
MFLNCWTCSGRNTAHHRELKTVIPASGFTYVFGCRPLPWLSHRSDQKPKTCRSKHVEQLRNIGILKSTIRLHLVGSFYEIYIAMHGSMNDPKDHCCVHSISPKNPPWRRFWLRFLNILFFIMLCLSWRTISFPLAMTSCLVYLHL